MPLLLNNLAACRWGSEEEGLLPPPRLGLNTMLRSVKHVNSTYYHYVRVHDKLSRLSSNRSSPVLAQFAELPVCILSVHK